MVMLLLDLLLLQRPGPGRGALATRRDARRDGRALRLEVGLVLGHGEGELVVADQREQPDVLLVVLAVGVAGVVLAGERGAVARGRARAERCHHRAALLLAERD